MGETADALIESGEVEPLVIVGIYNTGAKRIDEYTPLKTAGWAADKADAYGQMLVEELKPFVAHHYRTLAARELRHGRIVAGWTGHACISACAIPTCLGIWRYCLLRSGGAIG